MRALICLLFLLASPALAGPAPDALREAALSALAEGQPGKAAKLLRKLEAPTPADTCALGRALLNAKRYTDAAKVLRTVPLDAPCGRRAAFDRADALLATGKADDAEALYATLAPGSLGEDRDHWLAEQITQLAHTLRQRPDHARDDQAHNLNLHALTRTLSNTTRAALATRVADALIKQGAVERAMPELFWPLLATLPAEPTPLMLARIARLMGRPGLRLLAHAPDHLAVREARVSLLQRANQSIEALIDATKDPKLRAAHHATLAGHLRAEVIKPLLAQTGDKDAEVALKAASLLWGPMRSHGRAAEYLDLLLTLLPKHPTKQPGIHALMTEAAQVAAQAAIQRKDWTAARTQLDRVTQYSSNNQIRGNAQYQAALIALRAGDQADAKVRFEVIRNKGQAHHAAALDGLTYLQLADHTVAQIRIWLAKLGLSTELDLLDRSQLALYTERQRPGRPAQVRLRTRNLDTVALRLHRVDAEAFIRSGGTPAQLSTLDVTVVAPDHRLDVKIANRPGRAIDTQADLGKLRAGVYRITAAGGDREASAVLWISDLNLVTHTVGDTAIAAVFSGGAPARGVEVAFYAGSKVVTKTTGKDGLARATLPSEPLRILATRKGAVALAELNNVPGKPAADLSLGLDLGRQHILPGEPVGFRLIARRGLEPVQGRFEVSFAGLDSAPLVVNTDARGLAHGELRAPPLAQSTRSQTTRIIARSKDATTSASIKIQPPSTPLRWLTIDFAGTDATVTAHEPQGGPAANIELTWQDPRHQTPQRVRTDAHGQITISGPPAGVPWRVKASMTGTSQNIEGARPSTPDRLRATLTQHHIRSDERGQIHLSPSSGAATVRIFALNPEATPDDALIAPWAITVRPNQRQWAEVNPSAPTYGRRLHARVQATLDAKEARTLTLPALPEGHWAIDVVDPSGTRPAQALGQLIVVESQQLRLAGIKDALPGDTLKLTVNHPALVIAEGAHGLLAMATARPGKALNWAVTPAWRGRVTLAAVDARNGEWLIENINVDAKLDVSIRVDEAPDGWTVHANVRDARGRPVTAQVALSAIDARTWAAGGQPGTAQGVTTRPASGSGPWTRVFTLLDAHLGAKLSGRQLAERQRVAEAQQALSAQNGQFQNRAGNAPLDDLITENSFGFGGVGSGGGGGYGRGAGRANMRQGRARIRGGAPTAGHRARVLWAVGETDAKGHYSTHIPRPRGAHRWQLTASAATATAYTHHVEAFTPKTPWLAPHPVGVASPGETVTPAFIVPGNATGLTVTAGDETHPVQANRRVLLRARAPGDAITVALKRDGATIDTLHWRLPIARLPARADGPILEVALDAGGGLPLATIALADVRGDLSEPARAVALGRAAKAVRASAHPSHHAALDAAILDAHRALLAQVPKQATVRAEAVLFRSEARAELKLPDGVLRRMGDALPAPGPDPIERTLLVRARAAVGAKVHPGALARLKRAELRGPARAHLGWALAHLDDRAGALARADGDDVWAAALRKHLRAARSDDAQRTRALPAPLPGDVQRLPWLQALTGKPGRAKGTATVNIDGKAHAQIDLSRGGLIQLVAAAGSKVTIDHPGAILTRRGTPDDAEAPAPTRWLAGPQGTPLRIGGDRARCANPCTLGLGDALALPFRPTAPGWHPPAGMQLEHHRGTWLLRAASPAIGQLHSLNQDRTKLGALAVHIAPQRLNASAYPAAGLEPGAAIQRARYAAAMGDDPAAWLNKFDEAAWGNHAAEAAGLHLQHTLSSTKTTPSQQIDAFEAARELQPNGKISFAQIALIARAYRANNNPTRAIQVWRAGLGGAFIAEAAAGSGIEQITGRLANARIQRSLIDRYPAVPAVGRSLFHLPQHLDALIAEGNLPAELVEAGITPTDLRLLAAQWDRDYLAGWPDGQEAAEAGFHLVRILLHLRADAIAARWAQALADQHPTSPMLDGLLYLRGLALARTGDTQDALKLFQRIADEDFPQGDGTMGPGESQDDARYAAARVLEATGKYTAARELYAKAENNDEATVAHAALTAVHLSAPKIVRAQGGRLSLTVETANLATLHLRAYRLDLPALFVRDAGLHTVRDLHIAGVTPAWSGRAKGNAKPFPRKSTFTLPLRNAGAWLVQISGDGAKPVATLVVRSELSIHTEDTSVGRRVRVTSRNKPLPGVDIRWADGSSVGATHTDVRGIAVVPENTHVLAWRGDNAAFANAGKATPKRRRHRRARPAPKNQLEQGIDRRMKKMLKGNRADYDQFLQEAAEGVDAKML